MNVSVLGYVTFLSLCSMKIVLLLSDRKTRQNVYTSKIIKIVVKRLPEVRFRDAGAVLYFFVFHIIICNNLVKQILQ